MSIDWNHFTPWTSLSGGLLLGVAAGALILLNGRILGISGILGGLLSLRPKDIGWRVTFLLGMAAAPTLYLLLAPAGLITVPRIDAGYATLITAGLLVGLGTRYGSGCTSGHGVCGVARLSLRSLAATGTFICAGLLTVLAARHLL